MKKIIMFGTNCEKRNSEKPKRQKGAKAGQKARTVAPKRHAESCIPIFVADDRQAGS